MMTIVFAAALAATQPAPAAPAPDQHANHGMTGELHGPMCKDCKSGDGTAKHDGMEGCCCCQDGGHHGAMHGDHGAMAGKPGA